MNTLQDLTFYQSLPKVELHAHINGSISKKTMEQLVQRMPEGAVRDWRLQFDKGDIGTLPDAMRMFKFIHTITSSNEATYKITYDVIHDFEADNVKYLELRTTPREDASAGMTKRSYIEAVLKAIDDSSRENLDIIVRLLLAIDRRNSVDVAMETVMFAEEYADKSNGIIVGIDFSGDPFAGNATAFIPVFRTAEEKGLKLALHLAEVPSPDMLIETTNILMQIRPGRIGHGTCLHEAAGGSDKLVDMVTQLKIPLELCLSSNVATGTVMDYDNHHIKFWMDKHHPCVICTDDKGVFSTSLSEEYSIAASTFDLSNEEMWRLSYSSIDYIFADDVVKQELRDTWSKLKPSSGLS